MFRERGATRQHHARDATRTHPPRGRCLSSAPSASHRLTQRVSQRPHSREPCEPTQRVHSAAWPNMSPALQRTNAPLKAGVAPTLHDAREWRGGCLGILLSFPASRAGRPAERASADSRSESHRARTAGSIHPGPLASAALSRCCSPQHAARSPTACSRAHHPEGARAGLVRPGRPSPRWTGIAPPAYRMLHERRESRTLASWH